MPSEISAEGTWDNDTLASSEILVLEAQVTVNADEASDFNIDLRA